MLWLFHLMSSLFSFFRFLFFFTLQFPSSCTQIERHGQFQKFWTLTFLTGPVPVTKVSLFSRDGRLSANDIGSRQLVTSCAPDMKLP